MAAPTSAQYRKKTLREVALGYSDGATPAAMAYTPLNSAGVTVTPETQDLVTQGTTQRYHDRDIASYGITVDQQVVEDALLQIAHSSTTTGLGAGIAKRYHGNGVMPDGYWEIRLKYTMINLADGTTRTEYWRFPKCAVTAADPSANSPAQQITNSQIIFTAEKATKDLTGTAIVGAPADGDWYVVDVAA